VSVGVAHGRMDRDEIEDVMFRFMNNEYQVLVCTTIIETGIDIPNANTMIVDQAENFGLSQLYQIRGRVGRSDRVAYTYLMYPPKKQLSEVATKRLQAIKEFTQLGSGYKIAMRDLTIRGAGDMLGEKQSGFINTVGMDMYIELLKEEIAKKKNMSIIKEEETIPFNVQVEAYIPKAFADEDLSKITIYQEIQKINSLGKLKLYYDEIVDNYGRLPVSVEMLFEKKRLEILLKETRIETFKERMHHIECIFTHEYSQSINGIAWFEQVNELSSEMQLKYKNNRISIHMKKQDDWVILLNKLLLETKKEKYYAN
jgi:transcription-repair coupling factor (superfamily II helicase)